MSESRLNVLLKRFKSRRYSVSKSTPWDNDGTTRLDICPNVSLPQTYETYLTEQLSSNTRQRFRRIQRQVTNDDNYAIRLTNQQRLTDDINQFKQLWLQRWSLNKGSRAKLLADKYGNFIKQGVRKQFMQVKIFEHSGQPVAISCSYDDRVKKELLFFVGARDSNFQAIPAGTLLHLSNIEWAITHRYKTYDFLRGDESYKHSFGATNNTLDNFTIRNSTPPANARLLDKASIKQALALAKKLESSTQEKSAQSVYGQLLDCWPTDRGVVLQYADWLNRNDRRDQAEAVQRNLTICPV